MPRFAANLTTPARSIIPFLVLHLGAIGYRGWVGCEYKPRTTTVDGLGWHAALTLDT